MRYMFFITSDRSAAPPAPELMEEMARLIERESRAGTLLDTGGLMPLEAGGRVRVRKRKAMVVDGPFAEVKEVIGGYAIMELPSHEVALAKAVEFMELHARFAGDWEGQCEFRLIAG